MGQSNCFQMNFGWTRRKTGTGDGSRPSNLIVGAAAPAPACRVLPHCCYNTLLTRQLLGWTTHPQNGTCLLEATVPYSAIELICHMTGRQTTRMRLEPSDFGLLSLFPLCMQLPLRKRKESSLSPRQTFICGPISKGSLWVFIASAWAITAPLLFLQSPKAQDTTAKIWSSQVRLCTRPYSQEPCRRG